MKKAILTVIGKDQVGIIAGISAELGKLNINILNVNQTIMDGYFTMLMKALMKLKRDYHKKDKI